MLVFPNCKINLGLNIIRKRPDGYHDLETIFYPIPLCDALEVIATPNQVASSSNSNEIQFSASGLAIEGDPANNLCLKAHKLLKKDFPALPAMQMHLHKTIPMGAGLGGGSSNGSFALQLINKIFQLGIPDEQLLVYALELGSDCPFFIINKPCFATGRGEHLQPVELNLKGYQLLLINPGIHISTREAFSSIQPANPVLPVAEIVANPIIQWKDQLSNDFEKGVFQQYPLLAQIKQSLYDAGALYASMTGSGSTIFGIFPHSPAPLPSFDARFLIRQIGL